MLPLPGYDVLRRNLTGLIQEGCAAAGPGWPGNVGLGLRPCSPAAAATAAAACKDECSGGILGTDLPRFHGERPGLATAAAAACGPAPHCCGACGPPDHAAYPLPGR